ncbi:hypothetical protein BG004_001286 [Podila humilis]|nr:hypothetical protein BG004_001286 [Podila humilis]
MSQPERRRGKGEAAQQPAANAVATGVNATGANAAAAGQGQPQQQQQSVVDTILQMAKRAMIAYLFINLLNGNLFKGKTPNAPATESIITTTTTTTVTQPDGTIVQTAIPEVTLLEPNRAYPLWAPNTKADVFVYLSEDYDFNKYEDNESLIWRTNDIQIGSNWKDERIADLSIVPSKHVQNNGTLYAHIYVAKQPATLNPSTEGFDLNNRVYVRKALTRYFVKKREVKVKKLVGGSNEEVEEEKEKPEEASEPASSIVSYWHQNLTINVLNEQGVIPYASVPPEFKELYQLEASGKIDENGNGFALPTVYINEFWLLKSQMTLVNETVHELPLRINLYPLSQMKFQMYAAMDISTKRQSGMMGATGGGELDEVKRMLIETNPYLLAVTIAVSLLHSAFEMLAFKNDIAFWKDKKGTAGLSVRTIFLDIFQQIIVFLYLMDNNQETSYMILIGQGMGLAIELWKVKKALKVDIVPATSGFFPYKLHFNNSEPLTDLEEKTKEYDEEAFKYLTYAAFPLLGCYAIWSMVYQEHKSWYSFIVGTLVGFVYTFGFIKMTPQLFINYKLKSVAHMPFRTMMYKSLNTFIDDLFSFVIKMPMLHRLACLRDDVVFFIYLYQRYIYRTDHSRANEFGQVGDDDDIKGDKDKEVKEVTEKGESKKDK